MNTCPASYKAATYIVDVHEGLSLVLDGPQHLLQHGDTWLNLTQLPLELCGCVGWCNCLLVSLFVMMHMLTVL